MPRPVPDYAHQSAFSVLRKAVVDIDRRSVIEVVEQYRRWDISLKEVAFFSRSRLQDSAIALKLSPGEDNPAARRALRSVLGAQLADCRHELVFA